MDTKKVKSAIEKAADTLKKEGVQFFLIAVDRQPKSPDGGKVIAESDIDTENLYTMLNVAFPSREDIQNLGVWVGRQIIGRSKRK